MSRDQAATLRRMQRANVQVVDRRRRVIAVTGGKGGIGKSTISVNLSVTYAIGGARTLMVDGDAGMADLNLLLGIAPGRSALDVIHGCPIGEAIVQAHGVSVLPGLNGSFHAANIDAHAREKLLKEVVSLAPDYDTLVIDTAAGIGETTIGLAGAAAEVVCVANPEPLSIADAYACLKALVQRTNLQRAFLLPNAVRSASEAAEMMARLSQLVERFLGIELIGLPAVPFDPEVRSAGACGTPLVLRNPESPASRAIERVARTLDQLSAPMRQRGTLDQWLEVGQSMEAVS